MARYINGLRYEIQDEFSLLNLKIVEDVYQASSRVEEKLLRRHNQNNRGISKQEEKDIEIEEVSFIPLRMR